MKKTGKIKHPKMDPYLINSNENYELDHVVKLMRQKWGITTSRAEVRKLARQYGHSRKRVYLVIRESYLSTPIVH